MKPAFKQYVLGIMGEVRLQEAGSTVNCVKKSTAAVLSTPRVNVQRPVSPVWCNRKAALSRCAL